MFFLFLEFCQEFFPFFDIFSEFPTCLQAGISCGDTSKANLTRNFILKTRMLRFSRHSRQKCRKRSFLRQKRAVLAFLQQKTVFSDFMCATLAQLREDQRFQNGWIFWKVPNGRWPPPPPLPHFRKIMLRIVSKIHDPFIMAKICNINIWIGNDPPPFGTFPKIH